MSHKTGKRVLTASTTLALAAVGLAALPAHAAASVITPNNGCGTADTLIFTQPSGTDVSASTTVKGFSVNGGPTQGLPAANVNGEIVIPLTTYDANGKGVKVDLIADNNTIIPAVDALVDYDNSKCVISNINAQATVGYDVTAPTVSGDVEGATLTLHYQEGIDWVVNVDGASTTYSAAAFGATPADDVTKVITVTGASVVVTGVPVNTNYVTSPSPLSWTFSADGVSNASAPVKPTIAVAPDAVDATVTPPPGTGFTWKSSPTYVVDPSAATAAAATLAPGQTLRYWAIADAGYKFSDGTTAKYFDVSNIMNVIMSPAAPTWNDRTGTANDTFLLANTTGVRYFYAFSANDTAPAFTAPLGVPTEAVNTAAGWKAAAEGVEIAVPSANYVHVVAVLNDVQISRFNTGTVGSPVYDTAVLAYASPQYTANVVVTPAAPSFVDASGADSDTFTMPAFTTGVTTTVTATGGTAVTVTADNAGKTYARPQWGAIFGLDNAELTGPVVLATTAVPATAGYTLAPVAYGVAPWTVTLYAGQNADLPSPQFVDNSGNTTADVVKVTKVANVAQQVNVDAAGLRTITDAEYTNGISVAAGAVVQIKATADNGYTLVTSAVGAGGVSVLSVNNTVATFDYDFNNTSYVTAAVPIADNKAGTDADTYTIVGASGVDYYVNGVKFDPAKFNLPQSTGGAATITVTAVPQSPNTWEDGATIQKSWTLEFPAVALEAPTVSNAMVEGAALPTSVFAWGAEGATSYTVTYQLLNDDGTVGPELPWLTDTELTSRTFIGAPDSSYRISVAAKDDAGNVSEQGSSDVKFAAAPVVDKSAWVDLTGDNSTVTGKWVDARNVKNDYFMKSSMAGYNGTLTLTVPAGSKKFELIGTIFPTGGSGTIQVNGRNWADFTQNGTVAQPYQQMLRRLNLPATNGPITIRIIARNGAGQILALDAYKATNS